MNILTRKLLTFTFFILAGCSPKNNLIIFEHFEKDNERIYGNGKRLVGCNKNKQIELWFKDRAGSFPSGLYDSTDLGTITNKVEKLLPKDYKAYPSVIQEYMTKNGKCVSCVDFRIKSKHNNSMMYNGYVAFVGDTISDIKIFESYIEDKYDVKMPCVRSISQLRKKGLFIEIDYFESIIRKDRDQPIEHEITDGDYIKSTIWKLDEKTGKFILLGNVDGRVNG